MKKLCILIFSLASAIQTSAVEMPAGTEQMKESQPVVLAKKMELDLGIGPNSNFGFIGFTGRYFVKDNFDLSVSIGADIGGTTLGLGSRFYTPLTSGKCLIFIPCESNWFVGLGLLHNTGGNEDIYSYDDGSKGIYRHREYNSAALSLGFRDVYNWLTVNGEVGYRQNFSKDVDYVSGFYSPDAVTDSSKPLLGGFLASFSFGILF